MRPARGPAARATVVTQRARPSAARSGSRPPDPMPIAIPWTNFLVSLIVVPLVAMLGAGLLTRSRLPSERRAA
jgi:hypothetical protein